MGIPANGSVLTFGSAISKVKNIDYDASAAEIDVTGLTDTQHTYIAGLPNPNLTVTVVGSNTLTIGTTNSTCTIGWGGTTTSVSLGSSVLTGNRQGAGLDGAIESTLTFRPYGGG